MQDTSTSEIVRHPDGAITCFKFLSKLLNFIFRVLTIDDLTIINYTQFIVFMIL